MKTRIPKRLLNILLVALFVVVLAQLYCADVELKYDYEAIAWRDKDQTDQFNKIIAASYRRTHQDAQKIAALEAHIRTLTSEKGLSN